MQHKTQTAEEIARQRELCKQADKEYFQTLKANRQRQQPIPESARLTESETTAKIRKLFPGYKRNIKKPFIWKTQGS